VSYENRDSKEAAEDFEEKRLKYEALGGKQ